MDSFATVDWRAIPDYQELTGDLAQDMLEKANHVRSLESAFLLHHQQLTFRSDATNYREMVAAQVLSQNWRLTGKAALELYRVAALRDEIAQGRLRLEWTR